MKKITDIFSETELEYLSKKRPDLVPKEVPSLSDANLLNEPTLDQLIVYFLQQYEVFVEPRSVGQWNGWDTISGISSFFSSNYGSMRDIASTMFYANRSNQINTAAQEWGIWKRWVFDKKGMEFKKYKDEVMQSVRLHNNDVLRKVNEEIKRAELNNQKIFAVLNTSFVKQEVSELEGQNLKETCFQCLIYGTILFLIILLGPYINLPIELIKFIKYIQIIINLLGVGIGVKLLITKSSKRNLGIISIIGSLFLFINIL